MSRVEIIVAPHNQDRQVQRGKVGNRTEGTGARHLAQGLRDGVGMGVQPCPITGDSPDRLLHISGHSPGDFVGKGLRTAEHRVCPVIPSGFVVLNALHIDRPGEDQGRNRARRFKGSPGDRMAAHRMPSEYHRATNFAIPHDPVQIQRQAFVVVGICRVTGPVAPGIKGGEPVAPSWQIARSVDHIFASRRKSVAKNDFAPLTRNLAFNSREPFAGPDGEGLGLHRQESAPLEYCLVDHNRFGGLFIGASELSDRIYDVHAIGDCAGDRIVGCQALALDPGNNKELTG